MNERDKSFCIRAVTVGSIIALLFGIFVYINALWEGKAVFPEQLANAIVFLLVAAVSSASVWLRRRDHQETRQAVHDEAQEIKATLKDGSADVIAEKVKEKVEPVIREGDRRQDDMPIAGGRRRRDGRV